MNKFNNLHTDNIHDIVFPDEFENNNDIIVQNIHIRIIQRNSSKYITTIEGLDSEINIKKLLKYMKKSFSCNGSIKKTEEKTKYIQLSIIIIITKL